MAKHSLKIASRFALVLLVAVPALLGVAFVGYQGLRAGRDSSSGLYLDNLVHAQDASNLAIRLGDAQQDVLRLLAAESSADKQQVTTDLLSNVAPDIAVEIATLRVDEADRGSGLAAVGLIAASWAESQQVFASGVLIDPSPSVRAYAIDRVTTIHHTAAAAAASIVRDEGLQGARAQRQALASYRDSVRLMVIAIILGLVAVVGIVLWLIRSVLSRTLAYSAFASEVTHGEYSKRLLPRGGDELAQLGRTLDTLAEHRQAEDAFQRTQQAFADALQQAETEREVQELLKRHLELIIEGSTVTVLNRNNSADRLEAVSCVTAGSPLVSGLVDAAPRSCLAVRLARPYLRLSDSEALLACPVCAGCPAFVSCTPLLVGGEVIGSVLVDHPLALGDHERRSIRETVAQAAPVLGNLRNLAVVEVRAATDTLTGLPNRRALQDMLRHMVAQSERTAMPLAALMCDVDHFKQINDRFGHGRGDDVLAALGVVVASTLRASDFASRLGGEEFLVLLPATDQDGAYAMAEKLRAAVGEIRVPTVDQRITLSVGIAVLPTQAEDAESLQRCADRALYAAKNAGRDRAEIFISEADPRSAGPLALTSGARAKFAGHHA